MFDLTGKVALVTGGGSGIGESICKTFAQAGASVCILDRNEEGGRRVAEEIIGDGYQAKMLLCDVTSQESMEEVASQIAREFQAIDILVCNAGIAHVGDIMHTSEADMDRVYSVNVKGVYNSMYSVIPYMMDQRRGVIVNMASIASSLGINKRFAYSMSKGAVLTMTYSVAKDYLDYNIRCNAISPARVHTPFVDDFIAKNYPGQEEEMFDKLSKTQPIGRMGKPEEIAILALYLSSDEASFITGSNFSIDGGFTTLNGN